MARGSQRRQLRTAVAAGRGSVDTAGESVAARHEPETVEVPDVSPDTDSAATEAPEIEELRGAVVELRAMVAALVDRQHVVEDPNAAAVEHASRVLVTATESAEKAVLAAEGEADEILAHARARSLELIGVARDLAESELASERIRINGAAAGWVDHRAAILAALGELDEAVAVYRSKLVATGEAVFAALAHLRADAAAAGAVAAVSAPPMPQAELASRVSDETAAAVLSPPTLPGVVGPGGVPSVTPPIAGAGLFGDRSNDAAPGSTGAPDLAAVGDPAALPGTDPGSDDGAPAPGWSPGLLAAGEHGGTQRRAGLFGR